MYLFILCCVDIAVLFAAEAPAMLVAAFSKLVPRALQKKVATTFWSSDVDARTSTETNLCHIVLLDDTEIQLEIRVGDFIIFCSFFVIT